MTHHWILIITCFVLASSVAGAQALQESATLEFAEGLKLHMKVAPFDAAQFPLTESNGMVVGIGDCPPVGVDGGAPSTVLIEAVLQIGATKVALDVSCMFNPWFRSPYRPLFSTEQSGDWIRVRGRFSDGAGSYVAEWWIVGGRSVRTILTSDSCSVRDHFCPEG